MSKIKRAWNEVLRLGTLSFIYSLSYILYDTWSSDLIRTQLWHHHPDYALIRTACNQDDRDSDNHYVFPFFLDQCWCRGEIQAETLQWGCAILWTSTTKKGMPDYAKPQHTGQTRTRRSAFHLTHYQSSTVGWNSRRSDSAPPFTILCQYSEKSLGVHNVQTHCYACNSPC